MKKLTIRAKRRICLVTGWGCLAAMLGAVGGMERFWMSTGAGAAWSIGLTAAGAALLWKAGWFRWRR